MNQFQGAASRTAWRLSTLAFLVLAGGCGTSGTPPDAQPPATPGAVVTASVPAASPSAGTAVATPEASTAAPSATSDPSQSDRPVLPPEPPAALLAGSDGVPVSGELGGFTWNGAGDDAPWIVPRTAHAVTAPGPYAVSFGGDLAPARWVLRWAPVMDGAAGDVAAWVEGVGGPVTGLGPDEPGTWSLQADVRFADGHSAAWYWLVKTGP